MIEDIILGEEVFPKPRLKKSDKYSTKELSKMLLSTVYRGYGNSAEPLLVLGLAVMAPFKNLLIKDTKGYPVAYLYGTTGSGKTTILNNVAFMHGFDDHYAYSGDSTVLSMWQNLDRCNCIPIIYEEISKSALNNGLFEGCIKAAFQGINRDKIAKVKTNVSATLMMSSNYPPPQRSEILNRLVLCDFEPKNFIVNEVKDFNKTQVQYLSNLLPSIVRQKPDEVMSIFEEKRTYIKSLNSKLDNRCINNIAIAYAGYQILLNIAEEEQPDETANSFNSFIRDYDKALNVETPWEEFLTSLPLLARNKAIMHNKDYKYEISTQEKSKNNITVIIETPSTLYIHFEQAYKAFSEYYRHLKRDLPPSSKELLLYAKNDTIIFAGKEQVTKSININGIKKRCLVIDVLNDYDLSVLNKM